MSNISEVYDLIVGMDVTFTTQNSESVTPTAYDLDGLKNSVQSSGTPARLLTPFSDREQVTASMGEWTPGNYSTITWRLTDLLLWRPASEGLGIGDLALDIIEYISAYMSAANAVTYDTISSGDRVEVVAIDATARDDIQYPAGSGNWFVGVEVVWTIQEDDPVRQ